MTIAPPGPPARMALVWSPGTCMQRKPHGQRWGEGVASVLDHLQHDRRHQPHPAGAQARPSPQRERKE